MNKFFLTLAMLFLSVTTLCAAQQRNAFIDPSTGVLVAVGYVEKNAPGEIKIPVPADFNLSPGEWRWDGKTWVALPTPVDPVLVDLQELSFSIDKAVSSPAVQADLKEVLLRLKKVLVNGK